MCGTLHQTQGAEASALLTAPMAMDGGVDSGVGRVCRRMRANVFLTIGQSAVSGHPDLTSPIEPCMTGVVLQKWIRENKENCIYCRCC